MKCTFCTVIILPLANQICGACEIGSEILDRVRGIHNRIGLPDCGPGFRS